MDELFTSIITGVAAFSATNIDDLVILLVFFTQVNDNFRSWQVVCGQYLGFTILLILSLPGLLGGLILPPELIGLLGLVPLAIGISSLVNQELGSLPEETSEITLSKTSISEHFLSPQIYTVALVTIANGSDNISIYIPLFSSTNLAGFILIIFVFFCLLAIWCYAAYKLTHQRKIADFFTKYGNYLVPFVLMGLGLVIVWKSQALSPIKLLASCICLLVLVKKS
ncbi:cadmium resistance transporter [Richelia sinica FACHB-800]|uniref:Cadmium resistance transporter n=1 Tax=Richelia sinica FACHB-800 TaxID=1357546 RepID=A0A975Y660_9NOST|nr:cadmium resistance transporter [Richelia sinica]MBD2664043.1 cadmium resistance transporter [Richelia sinica FACHB-800]QXE24946.1 cadmium resistance transporter [Richelia sinica FACHB-800]